MMMGTESSLQAGPADSDLLAALLDGMEVGLAAMDADGVLTHWNREAERLLGWPAGEAVGRPGLAGWAVRQADAGAVRAHLLGALGSGQPQVHEFAMMTRDGRRVLVRAQASAVRSGDGRPLGLYFAFSEAGAQVELERSLGLAEALMDEAPTGVVLVDADLRPAAVGAAAARALLTDRTALLGRPLGEVLAEGVAELETSVQHVLATGEPLAGVRIRGALRHDPERRRHCWRSEFVRLGSPLGEEPVPLGVAWIFSDATEEERTAQEGAVLRFRATQLRRAGQAAAECEDPMEGAVGYLDFVLAGFADHALLDLLAEPAGEEDAVRLVRRAASPSAALDTGVLPGPGGVPVRHGGRHPAARALARAGTVVVSRPPAAPEAAVPPPAAADPAIAAGGVPPAGAPAVPESGAREAFPVSRGPGWAAGHRWPEQTVHGLCAVLRSRGRSLGVLTFLRGPGRHRFDRADAAYAEDIAGRVASAVDLALLSGQKL